MRTTQATAVRAHPALSIAPEGMGFVSAALELGGLAGCDMGHTYCDQPHTQSLIAPSGIATLGSLRFAI